MQSKTARHRMAPLVTMAAAVLGLLLAAPAANAALRAHGDVVHIVKPGLGLHASQSSNWFGYNQGAIEQGGKLFSSITGDWVVPSASQHTAGQDAASSTWIGIGGGCPEASCTVPDATLIQTGTEQDVTSGQAAYSAWWELIPAPSITISNFTVAPGDHMHASIAEIVPLSNLWTITLQDLTRGETFTQTVPYASTHATAEWIEETPLLIGANAGFSALPNLSNVPFDLGTVNGAPANLKASEEMQLIDGNGNVIGTPSAPDGDADGFAACAWATSCPTPSS